MGTSNAQGAFKAAGVIMQNVIRRETRPCPRCSLPLTTVRADGGQTFEYDVAKWGRLCHHPGSGGPLTCPGLQQVVKAWLCKT
jgi:hypothetical protein